MHSKIRKNLAPSPLLLGLAQAAFSGLFAFAQAPAASSIAGAADFPPTTTAPRAQPASLPYYVQPAAASYGGNASMLNSIEALNDQTKLKPGDQLSYRVVEEQDQQPDLLTVSPTGDVEVPLLGHYPAAGKTCRQLATQLKPLLEKDYFYKATVIVAINALSTSPIGNVYLTGQVKQQGAIPIPPNEVLTVSRAVLLDGGLADFADRRRVRLLHHNADGTTKTTIVDLKEVLDRGKSDMDPVVQDGDTIDVPQRLINF